MIPGHATHSLREHYYPTKAELRLNGNAMEEFFGPVLFLMASVGLLIGAGVISSVLAKWLLG